MKKGSNKKKDKHKNKQTMNATIQNGLHSTNDNEIKSINVELLKRLQVNGTSISVCETKEHATQQSKRVQDVLTKSNAENVNVNMVNSNSDKLLNNNNNKISNKNSHTRSKMANDVNSSENINETGSNNKQNVHCNGNITMTAHSSTSLPSPSLNQMQQEIQSTQQSCQQVLINSDSHSALSIKSIKTPNVEITFKEYENELQMPDIMRVIQRELSEPYSIYTYRYFIHNWPKLCFLAMDGDSCIGAIVCKLDIHRQMTKRGYIAMLAVDAAYRKLKVGTTLVQKAIEAMLQHNADEVVLETEITNIPALRLYENLGFVRDKRLFDYYLNGVDALRLKLWFK